MGYNVVGRNVTLTRYHHIPNVGSRECHHNRHTTTTKDHWADELEHVG
jgi:hypothetical protein